MDFGESFGVFQLAGGGDRGAGKLSKRNGLLDPPSPLEHLKQIQNLQE